MIAIPQFFAALFIGFFYYMLAAVVTVYEDPLSFIFQPIMGLFFTFFALMPLYIVGLPIRAVPSVNEWWRAHWWLPLLLGTVAFIMMIASALPLFEITVYDPYLEKEVQTLNPWLSIVGWLFTLFSVLHFYPPFNGSDLLEI